MTAASPSPAVVAAIIAGGRGTRFGDRRKGDVIIGGRAILERQLAALRPLFRRLLLVTNDVDPPRPAGVEVIADRARPSSPPPQPRQGPLAGIDAVLAALLPGETAAVCVAGDMPFLAPAALQLLRDHAPAAAALVPVVHGHPEPLFARYAQACAPAVAAALLAGRRKTSGFLTEVAVEHLPEATLRAADPHLLSLENLNTAEDLPRLEALALTHHL